MKIYIILLVLVLISIDAFSQRVIYSRTITLTIPANEIKKDTTKTGREQENKLNESVLNLIQKTDSIIISENNFSTEITVDIDTIYEKDTHFQTTKFTFQPVWETIQDISDYPSGNYSLESSSVSIYLANIVKDALRKNILLFMNKNAHLLIKIKGLADATAIKGIWYKNEFGEIKHSFYFNGAKKEIFLKNNEFLTQNEELAFLRTFGIRVFLEEKIPELQNFNIKFEHYIEVSKKVGGIYRRVSIEVIIKYQV